MSEYKYTRFIACEVPTVVRANEKLISGWDVSNGVPNNINLDNISNMDMKNRIFWLTLMVDKAYKRYETQYKGKNGINENDELKIFVLPEFYFRPPSSDNQFEYGCYSPIELSQLIAALENMFHKEQYKNWLFICGTVLTCDEIARTKNSLVYNRALIIRGNEPKESCYFSKKLTSNIDGVDFHECPEYHPQMKKVTTSDTAMKEHFLKKYQIGMEICLEHGKGVLKSFKKDKDASEFLVKLHILIAGGMQMIAGNIVAGVGGYFFRNDGMYSSNPPSQLVQVLDNRGNTETKDSVERMDLNIQFPLPGGIKNENKPFDQKMVFYPIVELNTKTE